MKTIEEYESVSMIIAKKIVRAIYDGTFVHKIPNTRDLAKIYNINFKTANRAVRILQEQGIVDVKRKTGTIIKPGGLAIAEKLIDTNPYMKLILMLMPSAGDVYGDLYKYVISNLHERKFLPLFGQYGVHHQALYSAGKLKAAGMIINLGWNQLNYNALKKVAESGTNIIFILGCETDVKIKSDKVLSDYFHGAYIATKHFIERGHKRIMLYSYQHSAPPEIYPFTAHSKMFEGYKYALKEAGLEKYAAIFESTADKRASMEKFTDIVTRQKTKRPTAVLCYQDYILARAMRELKKRGLKIPDDLAIAGYYNTPYCELCDIPLTSVSIKEETLSKVTVDCLLANIRPNNTKFQQKVELYMKGNNSISGKLTDTGKEFLVKPELIVRESSGT